MFIFSSLLGVGRSRSPNIRANSDVSRRDCPFPLCSNTAWEFPHDAGGLEDGNWGHVRRYPSQREGPLSLSPSAIYVDDCLRWPRSTLSKTRSVWIVRWNDCVFLLFLQELRCREEELRKAILQQKIHEEHLKKREQVRCNQSVLLWLEVYV